MEHCAKSEGVKLASSQDCTRVKEYKGDLCRLWRYDESANPCQQKGIALDYKQRAARQKEKQSDLKIKIAKHVLMPNFKFQQEVCPWKISSKAFEAAL